MRKLRLVLKLGHSLHNIDRFEEPDWFIRPHVNDVVRSVENIHPALALLHTHYSASHEKTLWQPSRLSRDDSHPLDGSVRL